MRRGLFVLAGSVCAAAAHAAILWDYNPSLGTYGGSWQNQTAFQNFAEMATFAQAVSITQYVYFTDFDPSTFGTMHVKTLADSGGTPGAYIDQQDVSVASFSVEGVFSGDTIYRVNLNVAPINLAAGSYWFGASGNGFEAAQVSMNPGPGDNQMAQFNGAAYSNPAVVGDQDFQLVGTVVPEPASCIALGSLAVLALRRRKRSA
jgi:hypothetical protein